MPFEFRGREAPDVDVQLVQPRVVAIAPELDLQLQLAAGHGFIADGTCRANTGSAPRAIRSAAGACRPQPPRAPSRGELVRPASRCTSAGLQRRAPRAHEQEAKPDAVGEDARRARQTSPMGGNLRIAALRTRRAADRRGSRPHGWPCSGRRGSWWQLQSCNRPIASGQSPLHAAAPGRGSGAPDRSLRR